MSRILPRYTDRPVHQNQPWAGATKDPIDWLTRYLETLETPEDKTAAIIEITVRVYSGTRSKPLYESTTVTFPA